MRSATKENSFIFLSFSVILINSKHSKMGVHENISIIGDLSETHRRPIGDSHAWSETHQRPQHASSETYMPDWRPTCLIGDPSQSDMTHRRPTCLRSQIGISTHLNIIIFIYFLLIYIYWNNILGSCEFQMGLRWSLLRSSIRHIRHWWISD